MNRFGFCKQEGPVFRIRDLNSPWRSVLHLGQRQMVGKSYQWEDDPETSTFSFLEKGRVRLLNLSETGKERIVPLYRAGVPLPRNRVAACFPFASRVAGGAGTL